MVKPGSAGVPPAIIERGRLRAGRPRSQALSLIVLLLAAVAPNCKPFNVKPRIEIPRATNESQAESDGITIRASLVKDEDWLNDTFDANLILAGILPLRVELKNVGRMPIDFGKARFELKDTGGRSFGSVDPSRAFKRALSYYDVSAWSKDLYKESRADFASYALDTKTPVAPGQSRLGLIYFLLPGASARENGFTLAVSRLKPKDSKGHGEVELKLN